MLYFCSPKGKSMSKNLVIVESPAKAKTIEKFLGEDYHVLSSQGHVRDIEGVGKNSIGIDFDNHYQPNYVVSADKQHLLSTLRTEAQKADTVWLASDEDREGEAIAWHLQEVLNLDPQKTQRIVFHEITKPAIQEAILHPRQVDYNLVNAQQARRVLDRIVGFELSPILWRKIITGLSAGRVQSVAVRLVVEREREIEDFKEQSQYRILADFTGKNAQGKKVVLHTELNHRFATKDQAIDFLDLCQKAEFQVGQIQTKPARRTPAAPFTTSSLQQEAAHKLKFTVSKTMRLAQALYEAGLITYMRTDSVHLSSLAIGAAKQEIVSLYGEHYHHARQYKTATKGAQEAHEAIRPTYLNQHAAGKTADEKKLYELIWKRTIASQMADAETETTRVDVASSYSPYTFSAIGEVMLFDGFAKVYIQSNDDESQESPSILPKVEVNQPLSCHEFIGQQTFTKPPFRYTEATLVKKMEELEIGRPSTYATIIETIQSRNYVIKSNIPGQMRSMNVISMKNGTFTDEKHDRLVGQDANKLIPTDLGRMTNDFLVEQFPEILSYDFTAREEENFDKIALGKENWVKIVDTFYKKFHSSTMDVPKGKIEGRLIGKEPKTGAPVIAKINKIGPCIQIGDADVAKPRFASIPEGMSIYTITLKQALALFNTTKNKPIFLLDGEEVHFGQGKFGAYIKYKGKFYSAPKDLTAEQVTPDKVREIINAEKLRAQPLRVIDNIQVLKGRYGLYIKDSNGNNYPLPKNTNLDELTLETCQQIMTNYKAPQKYARKHS